MADEVLLSVDANVLYATTRYVEPPKEPPQPSPTSKPTPTPAPKTTQKPPKQTQRPEPDRNWPWGSGGDDDQDEESRRVDVIKRSTKRVSQPGYITAILLTPLSETENPIERRLVGAGFPIRPLFQLATTTSGGLSNSVSPAPWGNDFFALADSEVGLIEVCQALGINSRLTNLRFGNLTTSKRPTTLGVLQKALPRGPKVDGCSGVGPGVVY